MRIELEVDVELVARQVNESVGDEVEDGDSVRAWFRDNQSSLPQLVADTVTEELLGAYE